MAVSQVECLEPTKVDSSDREKERQKGQKKSDRERKKEREEREGLEGRYIARKSGPPL